MDAENKPRDKGWGRDKWEIGTDTHTHTHTHIYIHTHTISIYKIDNS